MSSIIIDKNNVKNCQDNLSFYIKGLTQFSFPVHICGVTLDHSSFQYYFSQENTYVNMIIVALLQYISLTTNAVTVLFAYHFWGCHHSLVHMVCLINNGLYIWKIKSSQNTGLILILVWTVNGENPFYVTWS